MYTNGRIHVVCLLFNVLSYKKIHVIDLVFNVLSLRISHTQNSRINVMDALFTDLSFSK